MQPLQPASDVIVYDGDFKVLTTGQPYPIRWVCWNPRESYALLAGDRGLVLIYDGSGFRTVPTGIKSNLRGGAFRPDGSEALIVGNDGVALLYAERGIRPVSLGARQNLRRVAWKPNNEYALVIGNSGTCLRYDGSVKEIPGAENNLRSVSWHPHGTRALISANRYRSGFAGLVAAATIYRYEEGGSELEPVLAESRGDLIGVDWKPDGSYALAVGYDLTWHQPLVYRCENDVCDELPFPEESIFLTGVSWKPDGQYALLVSGGPKRGFGSGSVYEFREKEIAKVYSKDGYLMAGASWSNDGLKAIIFGSRRAVAFTV